MNRLLFSPIPLQLLYLETRKAGGKRDMGEKKSLPRRDVLVRPLHQTKRPRTTNRTKKMEKSGFVW
jgi:hypothetical protein